MIIPTALIIPPAILALIFYLWLYYVRNPENRVSDVRFLLALACVGVMGAQIFTVIRNYELHVASVVLCAAAFGLLMAAGWMLWDGPLKTFH